MRRIVGIRNTYQLILSRFKGFQHKPYCESTFSAEKGRRLTSTSSNGRGDGKAGDAAGSGGGDIRNMDVYRDLDKLDFMKAAKILFTHPPKTKKFGIDFHLVQLFFVCLPSLAVYLVAQYARYEMRRMDAELELKKKAEEEVKEKEAAALREKEGQSVSELLDVKERLQSLEKTVNEIVVETRKSNPTDHSSGKTHGNVAAEALPSAVSDPNQISGSVSDEKGKSQDGGSSAVK